MIDHGRDGIDTNYVWSFWASRGSLFFGQLIGDPIFVNAFTNPLTSTKNPYDSMLGKVLLSSFTSIPTHHEHYVPGLDDCMDETTNCFVLERMLFDRLTLLTRGASRWCWRWRRLLPISFEPVFYTLHHRRSCIYISSVHLGPPDETLSKTLYCCISIKVFDPDHLLVEMFVVVADIFSWFLVTGMFPETTTSIELVDQGWEVSDAAWIHSSKPLQYLSSQGYSIILTHASLDQIPRDGCLPHSLLVLGNMLSWVIHHMLRSK